MTKVSNENVLQFRRNVERYTQSHHGQFRPFLYVLNKLYSKTKGIENAIAEKEREIEIDLCEKDKDGYAIEEKSVTKTRGLNGETREDENRRFKYKPESLIALGKRKRALLEEEVEIEAHITDDIPEDMDFNWWRVFSPFVLPDLDELPMERLNELHERSKAQVK